MNYCGNLLDLIVKVFTLPFVNGKTFLILIKNVFLFVAFFCLLYSVFNVPDRDEKDRSFAISLLLCGGDKRARTAGLLNANQALSQLSYTPMRLVLSLQAPVTSL